MQSVNRDIRFHFGSSLAAPAMKMMLISMQSTVASLADRPYLIQIRKKQGIICYSSTACRIEEEYMNLQDMTPLAEGRVSHVYVSKDKHVLKLLHKTVPDSKVDDEFRRCQIILKAGVPSPRALEMVVVEGRRVKG